MLNFLNYSAHKVGDDKMAQQNLLDIVPDQLFQTHFISDIDQVQVKLQQEIERKRGDLRAMVGERYRDLIHAADTIEEMKDTTSSTLNHIKEMISACRNLHDTHLVGFKISEKPIQTSNYQSNSSVQSISLQVKLLMEIPEKIWTCIESQDFIKATQLFVLARHINTGLQLLIGGKTVKGNMLSLKKLIEQQWNSICNFNHTIVSVCEQRLQDININTEVACSSLISLYILDSKNMVELLNTLIGLHSNNSLKNTLHFDLTDIIGNDVKLQIKEKIVNSVKVVLETVQLVYACFIGQNGGAVLEKLKELFKKDSEPLIGLVHFSDPTALKLLPPVIANYKLTATKEIEELSKEDVASCVQKWSVGVKSYIELNVQSLLSNITRVKVLHEIREEAFKIETPENWSTICLSLDMSEEHVWCQYFQPLLTNRVKEIIRNRWASILAEFKSQLLADLKRVSSESCSEKEADINWFVWKDLIGETVIESRNDVFNVMNSLMKGMWLQDRGFTPSLEKLCHNLDNELQKLLEDLSVYLYKKKTGTSRDVILFNFDDEDELKQLFIDKLDIQTYLRDITEQNVLNMLQHVKDCLQDPQLNSNKLEEKTTAIYNARLIQAFTHLLPNLRKCLIYEENVYNNDESNKRWLSLCSMLKSNCILCWNKWIDLVMIDINKLTRGLPQEFTLEANVDYLMVQWDTIKISEKDDEEKVIESTIKVPSGPSLKLQEYLYSISRILDEVVPHTLPPEVHTIFLERVTDVTFTHYNKVIKENETDINQRCALQLLMDVRHLTMLLVPRENKKTMEFSHEICEFLRQKIDPFDYDVFYPYIQTNLKRSVQRVQTLLGSLILHHGQLSGILGCKPIISGGSADKTPHLLTMASTDSSQWFSLLPAIAAVNLHKKIEKTKKKPPTASPSRSARSEITDLMTSSLPINLASARSNAASFFNSMTSEWFSGGS